MSEPTLTFVVFSKDRPLQLHGLLRSLFETVETPVEVFVLYAATGDRLYLQYRQAFAEVSRFGVVHPVAETRAFADHLQEILGWTRTPAVAFLVDDIVFTRPWSPVRLLPEVLRGAIGSLRLSPEITYSYMTDSVMRLPTFVRKRGLVNWRWNQGSVDWSYPMSVDGNVFRTKEIRKLLSRLKFHSPNSLEARMNDEAPPFRKRRGVGFEQSVLVNNPANKVQTDLPGNRSGSASVQELSDLWDQGLRLDVKRYRDLTTISAHAELELHCVIPPTEAAL